MRHALAAREGRRARYTATVARFGTKPAYRGRGPALPTICLADVTDLHGHLVADHLWFTLGQSFARLDLQVDDQISFEATSVPYNKGRRDEDGAFYGVRDYKLAWPTRVRKIVHEPLHTLPLFANERNPE